MYLLSNDCSSFFLLIRLASFISARIENLVLPGGLECSRVLGDALEIRLSSSKLSEES
jgi:hypothetical protein